MTVVLNATDIHSPSAVRHQATKFVIHESFGLKSFDNDIGESCRAHPFLENQFKYLKKLAYIRLDEEVKLGPGVGILRLPKLADANNKFDKADTVTLGWGKPKSGFAGELPIPNLRYLTANVISNTKCWAFFPGYLKDTNVCTDIDVGTPCDSDEGGPLLTKEEDGEYTHIGLFSYQFSLLCDSSEYQWFSNHLSLNKSLRIFEL